MNTSNIEPFFLKPYNHNTFLNRKISKGQYKHSNSPYHCGLLEPANHRLKLDKLSLFTYGIEGASEGIGLALDVRVECACAGHCGLQSEAVEVRGEHAWSHGVALGR